MKKFILFFLIVAFFSVLNMYFIERMDFFRLEEKCSLEPYFTEDDGRVTMHWERLPYPCIYRIETFSKTTGLVAGEPSFHSFDVSYTPHSEFLVPSAAIPMYYQITAYGIFGRLTPPLEPVANPNFPMPPHPVPIYHSTASRPASLMPYLVWHSVPGAVCYEVEILSAPPEKEGGTVLSEEYHVAGSTKIYTNGWQADLREIARLPHLYWRVRAMNLQREPIGVFSPSEPLVVDSSLPLPDRPLLNAFDQMPNVVPPLYPVYQWIPMHDITRYEVELMTSPPATENGSVPSSERAWYMVSEDSFSCYDEYARPYAGTYYWRVRAIDNKNGTIGSYSDTASFTVAPCTSRLRAAAYGDSITHGGGALSYSPYNQEYNYNIYLDIPTPNLGHSGDTAHDSLLRFEEDVLPYRPYNLLILTGSNDLRSDVSAQSIIDDLRGIRKKCEDNDIRPIFLTLMPINPLNIYNAFKTETYAGWRDKMEIINAFIRQQEFHIDLEPYFYDATHTVLDTDLSIDGLHPDIRGKMLMAEIINAHADQFR